MGLVALAAGATAATAGAIGGGVAAVAAIGGGLLQHSAANNATKQASQAAANNNALQADIYQKNTANETPFMQRGNVAGGAINDLLGLGGGTGGTPGTQGQTDWNAYANGNPDVLNAYNGSAQIQQQFGTPGGYGQYHYQTYGQNEGRDLAPYTSGATPALSGPQAQNNAFSNFRNSTGYQFRLNQGLDAVNNNYATRGALDSGAAVKALNNYGQGMASNEFGNYLGALQNQQGVGLSATNALNGVGTNYANAVSSNNNNAAGVAGSAGFAGANALSQGLNGIGGAVGQYLGTQSSYSPSTYNIANQQVRVGGAGSAYDPIGGGG